MGAGRGSRGAVRRAFEAFAARDLSGAERAGRSRRRAAPLVSVWQRSYRGLEGLEEWFGEVNRTWAEFEFESEDVREIDADRMLVKAHWRGCAVAGGSEVGGPSAAVITFRGEKVVVADFFVNEEAAMAALGQPARNFSSTGAGASGSNWWVWPGSVCRSAFGSGRLRPARRREPGRAVAAEITSVGWSAASQRPFGTARRARTAP